MIDIVARGIAAKALRVGAPTDQQIMDALSILADDGKITTGATAAEAAQIEQNTTNISSLSEEKVNKSALSLVIGTDGKIYVAVNGVAVGSGIAISGGNAEGDSGLVIGSPLYSGRWAEIDGQMFTNANGAEIYAVLSGATTLTLEKADSKTLGIAVSINDGAYQTYSFTGTVIIPITESECTVKIVLNDILYVSNMYTDPQTVFIGSLKTDGTFLATDEIEEKPFILWLGDSITRGDAIGSANGANAVNSYPHLVSDRLGYRAFQIGYGTTGITVENSSRGNMPIAETCLTNVVDGVSAKYDAGKTKYVFINYGTNDGETDAFISGYASYVAKVKEMFPDSVIVCMQLITSAAKKQSIKTAADTYGCEYYVYDGGTLTGETHPDARDSEAIANNILYYIENVLNDAEKKVPVTGISAGSAAIEINTTGSAEINVAYTPSNTTEREVIFASDNTSVCTVSGTGVVTPVGVGICDITITSRYDAAISVTVPITVVAEQADMSGEEYIFPYSYVESPYISTGVNAGFLSITLDTMYANLDSTIGKVKTVVMNCNKAGLNGNIVLFTLNDTNENINNSPRASFTATIKDIIPFTGEAGVFAVPVNYENELGDEIYVGIQGGGCTYYNTTVEADVAKFSKTFQITTVSSRTVGEEVAWTVPVGTSFLHAIYMFYSDR